MTSFRLTCRSWLRLFEIASTLSLTPSIAFLPIALMLFLAVCALLCAAGVSHADNMAPLTLHKVSTDTGAR